MAGLLTFFKVVGQVILALPQIIRFIKSIKETLDEIKKEQKREEIRDQVDVAIETRDQTGLEEAIGSSNAGKPAVRRDGVQERPRQDRG